MKNKIRNRNGKNEIQSKELLFADLSDDLDRGLLLIVSLLEGCCSEADINIFELAHLLRAYLGSRAVLDSVFFNRKLGQQKMDDSKVKSELFRVRGIFRRFSK